jgi:hypothetical protein
MGDADRELDRDEREQLHTLQNSLAALRLWVQELSTIGACASCTGLQRESIEAILRLVDEATDVSVALRSLFPPS